MGFLKRLAGPRSRPEERLYLFLVQAPPPAKLSLAYATAADGSLFWPAFTDTAALLRWQPEGGQIASAPLSALRDIMTASGITTLVIDPGSPTRQVLGIDDLPASA